METALKGLKEDAEIVRSCDKIEEIGVLHFRWELYPERNQDVHVFRGVYNGPVSPETQNMTLQWWDIYHLPYEQMREDDPFRLPKLIAREPFNMTFTFDQDGKLIR